MGYEVIDKPLNIAPFLSEYERRRTEPIFNPFEAAEESEVEFCCICKDYLPTEILCRHLFYDSSAGIYSGAGGSEGKIEDAKEDILFFASKIKSRILVEMIKTLENNSFWPRFHGSLLGPVDIELKGECGYVFNVLDGFNEDQLETEEEYSKMQEGGNWMVTLEAEKTKEANTKAAQWLRESLVVRHENRRQKLEASK